MINNIQAYKNQINFNGIHTNDIKLFIPEITYNAAKKISSDLEKEIPFDILTLDKSQKKFIHGKKIEALQSTIPIGEITYNGKNNILEKLYFIDKIVQKIKDGSIYA